MNTHELQIHAERGLEALRREFAGKVRADDVTRIGRHRLDALLAAATINDFVPLLVYRQTRDMLLGIDLADLHRAV